MSRLGMDMVCLFFFFFNDTATTEIYTLSLHDALPISRCRGDRTARAQGAMAERLQVQDCQWCHHTGAGQPGESAEVAVQAGAEWRDEQVRGIGGRQETRIGALCPRRPRDRRQHSTPAAATSTTSTAQP